MNCPTCNVPLVMSERQGIEIDYCPQCRGIWLDRGELDKIIERSTPSTQQSQPDRDRDRDQQYYSRDNQQHHYKKKKGGLLGDLFDF